MIGPLRCRARRARRDDAGFFALWTGILTVSCWALVGLVYDAGDVLRERSRAFGAAAAAGRAGARAIDEDAMLVGGSLVLDEAAAQDRAREYLDDLGYDDVDIQVTGLEVHVVVRGDTDLRLLPGAVQYEMQATVRAVPSDAGAAAAAGP